MNKKLMALSLVIGLGFSQIPLQAGLIDSYISPGVSRLGQIITNHPVYTLVAVGSILGASYLAYNRNCIKNKITKWVDNWVNTAARELDVQGMYNAYQSVDLQFLQDIENFLNDDESVWSKSFEHVHERQQYHSSVTIYKNESRDEVEIEVETWTGIDFNKRKTVNKKFNKKDFNFDNNLFIKAIVEGIQKSLRNF